MARSRCSERKVRLSGSDRPFLFSEADLPGKVQSLIDEVGALPVSSNLVEKLVALLMRAATLLDGSLTEKAVRQGREALDEFRELIRTNRNQLGAQTADLV